MGLRRGAFGVALAVWASCTPALSAPDRAQGRDDDRSPWSVFPVISYSPETSALLGGGAVYTFRADDGRDPNGREARRSSIAAISAYSFKSQFFISLSPSVYLDGEAWHAEGGLALRRFPSTFYPIGKHTTADRAEDYTDLGLSALAALTRRLAGSFRTGGQIALYYSKIGDVEPGGDLDRGRVAGSDGGRLAGLGPRMIWDDRDNDFSTRRGGRYSLSATYFGQDWGSEFGVSSYELDARQFFALGGEHVIGAQVYGLANFGNVPFQAMAALGGANKMRGYFEGRFRDLCMFEVQVEYRMHLFWRFGGAIFAGAGDVGRSVDDFAPEDVKVAGGGGLRFALNQDDRVNLRLDAAGAGNGDVNFYVVLGEAF